MNPYQQAIATGAFLRRVGTDEFAAAVEERVASAGFEYFDRERQAMRFEGMEPGEILRYAEEELLDLAAYAWMLGERTGHHEEAALLAAEAHEAWRAMLGRFAQRGVVPA